MIIFVLCKNLIVFREWSASDFSYKINTLSGFILILKAKQVNTIFKQVEQSFYPLNFQEFEAISGSNKRYCKQ